MMTNDTLNTGVDEGRDQELFDRISEHYCRKDLVPASRRARQLRLQQTVKRVLTGNQQAILELGCGAGFSASYLEGRFRKYLGVDYSEKLIELARTHVREQNVEFAAENIKDLRMPGAFDGAFMIGVLHHLSDADETVRRVAECIRPGGWFALNEPSSNNPLINLARQIRKRSDRDYSEEQVSLSRRQMSDVLNRNGFENVVTYGQGILSTPFAEVVMPQWFSVPGSFCSCGVDRGMEHLAPRLLNFVSWNTVAVGYRSA
jgi:SAM-dependent methyltransferase